MQRPQLTPVDKEWLWDANSQLCGGALEITPEGSEAPLVFSAAGFLKPALPRTKTTLSETINSQENTQEAIQWSQHGLLHPSGSLTQQVRICCKTWQEEIWAEG